MNDKERENLLIHIEGLQATLTKRNQKIAELEAKLLDTPMSDEVLRAENRGFKNGWKACASKLMGTAHRAALELREIRADAFDLYLDGEQA